MPRKTNLSENDSESFDVFEAIRRALMRRGLIRQKKRQKTAISPREKELEEKIAEEEEKRKEAEGKPKTLTEVASKSHEILFKANTVFPFTLFPDTVTLDREKFTIATRSFFRVAKITSTPVRDILSAEVDVGPFFGSIHVSSKFFVSGPYSINFLTRSDAIRLQRMLQGYVIAHEQEIDCGKIERHELIKLLDKLGKGDTG